MDDVIIRIGVHVSIAGLPQDAWLEEGTEVSVFEGQIFKEEE